MQVVKKLKKFTVYKKRNGRFAVKNSSGKIVNGDEKSALLLAEGLVTAPVAKKVEAPAEETPAEAAAEE